MSTTVHHCPPARGHCPSTSRAFRPGQVDNIPTARSSFVRRWCEKSIDSTRFVSRRFGWRREARFRAGFAVCASLPLVQRRSAGAVAAPARSSAEIARSVCSSEGIARVCGRGSPLTAADTRSPLHGRKAV
jgi:hypothetical protein